MKRSYLYIILCVFFVAILILIIPNYVLSSERENFTPGIRCFYKPYERSLREGYNKFYNNLSHRSNMFFRKIGII
jgi:hypothetical protein